MVSPDKSIRSIARDAATHKMRNLPVQGKCCHLVRSGLLCTLEPSFHSCVKVPDEWRVYCLPQETHSELDLFPSLYRILRSIGGAWSELLHADSTLELRAMEWAAKTSRNKLTCPLCLSERGDTRHVIMGCRYMSPYVNLLRVKMEILLSTLAPMDQHHAWATEVREASGKRHPTFHPQDPQVA